MDARLRVRVWRRANRCCEYCRMPQEADPPPFQVDHVIAQQHQGETKFANLALACFSCNCHKGPNIGGRDPDTHELVPLFNPRHDSWPDHFVWAGAVLVGKTAIGRVTVQVLAINLPRRVAHRRAMIDEGLLQIDGT